MSTTDSLLRWRHIVIEGPIGVGKTSLARRLAAHTQGRLLLEQPEANPFLERFYHDAERWALPTQLSFLFQRVEQLRELSQLAQFEQIVISDFLLDKDPLFAQLTLDDEELALYQKMFRSLQTQVPVPDLVIYLQAPADTLIERVKRRGHAFESVITQEYLRRLSDAYSRFFHHYETSPLLMINTEHLNPIDREDDFALLLRQIQSMRGRREFFNTAI
jgi:thymidylate kinase